MDLKETKEWYKGGFEVSKGNEGMILKSQSIKHNAKHDSQKLKQLFYKTYSATLKYNKQ